MRAYYFDDLPGDQSLPHDSGIPVSNAALASIGVLLWHVPIPISVANDFAQVDTIALDREYKTIDVMAVTKEALGDLYEAQLKVFYSEYVVSLGPHGSLVLNITFSRHMHEDEEIRYVLEGGGFFDVHGKHCYHCHHLTSYPIIVWIENATNKWIRFVVNAGDLVLLPAGIYHRFTLDDRQMIKARMFFKARSYSNIASLVSCTHISFIQSSRTGSSGCLTTEAKPRTTTPTGWTI